MHHFAIVITALSLFNSVGHSSTLSLGVWTDQGHFFVIVSPVAANPLPVQGIKEARGIALELNTSGVLVEHEILRREASIVVRVILHHHACM